MSYIRISLVEDKKVVDDGVIDLKGNKISIRQIKEQIGFMVESVSTTEFTFGTAVEMLKGGDKMTRKGWNSKGMWIYYVPANSYRSQTEIAIKEFGEYVKYSPYMAIKNVDGTVSTWVPSVNDCLSSDWVIVE